MGFGTEVLSGAERRALEEKMRRVRTTHNWNTHYSFKGKLIISLDPHNMVSARMSKPIENFFEFI